MSIIEIFALIIIGLISYKVTGLWDVSTKAEKEVARKLTRQGIYGHFENGKFIFDFIQR